MSWTYKFDEIDKEVTKDQNTPGRFTFNRYMYFEPSEYANWSTNQSYNQQSYTAQIISMLPAVGSPLPGNLSNFYLNDVISITNIIEEEHAGHSSYAKATLEYENRRTAQESESINISYGGGRSSTDKIVVESGGVIISDITKMPAPWEQNVADFSVVSQEISMPWITGYIDKNYTSGVVLANTAGQPFYGSTTSIWTQKISWTVNTRSDNNYFISEPIVNSSPATIISGLIEIPPYKGLMLPPTFKRLYFNNDENVNTEYYQWSFEIIMNPMGFSTEMLNVGTKARSYNDESKTYDICSWYVYDPSDEDEQPVKHVGTFSQMMAAKKEVDQYNKEEAQDEQDKKVFSGDFIQSPVPLTPMGYIATNAIDDPNKTWRLKFDKYKAGNWSYLFR